MFGAKNPPNSTFHLERKNRHGTDEYIPSNILDNSLSAIATPRACLWFERGVPGLVTSGIWRMSAPFLRRNLSFDDERTYALCPLSRGELSGLGSEFFGRSALLLEDLLR